MSIKLTSETNPCEIHLMGVCFQSYQPAVGMAKRAEKTFQFERGEPDRSFIKFGYWDSLKNGLMAGEKLQLDLRRMEATYLAENKREYEITKHVSLATLKPEQLLALRATGQCEIDIPEMELDLDFPGHYMRRIKSVSMTIPCVSGPYNSINCKLTLLNNKIRRSNVAGPNYNDGPYLVDYCILQAIATSTAQNDSGLFELNFRDERYLPFEGAGAISKWRVELPKESNLIDLETVDDVVLHIRYTAREGGDLLKEKAKTALGDAVGYRLFSVRTEFPTEWALFLNPPAAQADHEVTLPLDPVRFEAHRGKASLTITKATFFAQWHNPAWYAALDPQLPINVDPEGATASDVPLAADPGDLLAQGNITGSFTTGEWVIKATSTAIGLMDGDHVEDFRQTEGSFNRLIPEALEDLLILCEYNRLPAS